MFRICAVLLCLLLSPCAQAQDYLFFLHNRFVEEVGPQAEHPQYGRSDYAAILDTFRTWGFTVISEKRPPRTDARAYARKVAGQVDSLLQRGVKPDHITIVGTSMGGYIAQYVSTYMANPELNFVFVACYMDSDIVEFPDISFCGNILTVYEHTDPMGVSAIRRKQTSKLTVTRFRQVELNTGLRHGFIFRPMNEWMLPCKHWARREYDF